MSGFVLKDEEGYLPPQIPLHPKGAFLWQRRAFGGVEGLPVRFGLVRLHQKPWCTKIMYYKHKQKRYPDFWLNLTRPSRVGTISLFSPDGTRAKSAGECGEELQNTPLSTATIVDLEVKIG
jgi:hypothetical protein